MNIHFKIHSEYAQKLTFYVEADQHAMISDLTELSVSTANRLRLIRTLGNLHIESRTPDCCEIEGVMAYARRQLIDAVSREGGTDGEGVIQHHVPRGVPYIDNDWFVVTFTRNID